MVRAAWCRNPVRAPLVGVRNTETLRRLAYLAERRENQAQAQAQAQAPVGR